MLPLRNLLKTDLGVCNGLPKWLDGSPDDGTLSILSNCTRVLLLLFIVP